MVRSVPSPRSWAMKMWRDCFSRLWMKKERLTKNSRRSPRFLADANDNHLSADLHNYTFYINPLVMTDAADLQQGVCKEGSGIQILWPIPDVIYPHTGKRGDDGC